MKKVASFPPPLGWHSNPFFRPLKENCLSNWLFSQTSCNEAKLYSPGYSNTHEHYRMPSAILTTHRQSSEDRVEGVRRGIAQHCIQKPKRMVYV